MKDPLRSLRRRAYRATVTLLVLLAVAPPKTVADPATLLFEDNFTGGIPGWTAVQPAGAYIDGPMLWQYDVIGGWFTEPSNIYTDSATASTSRRAVMVINDTVAPPSGFSYSARLTAGDDDGFGLIWGFENEGTFYRAAFARQNRFAVGWPFQGIFVDRMSNGVPVDLAGGAGGPFNSFINTGARPFDVTIGVTNGLLTIVIVDDPLGAAGGPFIHNPLTDVLIPATPSGKVGILQWGQSGNTPRSFRIQNPVLSPTPLAGNLSMVLSNWSFTVTPSATNDYPVNTATWSVALGENGRKFMCENNDSAPENNTFSSTNTPVFAAVAGDLNWSNYVYSARLRTPDDDGFGMFLRYQDRTNWYRISFRSQNSQSGIKRGISVQKNVNRTFDEMLSSTTFLPPTNSAFDVHAAIRDNSLQIMCVVNPDSTAPTITSFGPIDMSASSLVPANLGTGKVGVFSWAQFSVAPSTEEYGTGVESVKVQQVNGEGLLVSSAYGTPDPPLGLNDLPVNGLLTARVDSAVVTAPGVRQMATGWSGAGSVPGSGTTNEVIFTLNQFSLLTWKWQTQYQLTVNATTGGNAMASLGPWINPGSNVTVTATANAGYVFTGWSGDNISTAPILTFAMVRPVMLTANFAVDSDNDDLPDSWEQQYFGAGNLSENETGNPDLDGANNLAEYQAGTDPKFMETLIVSDGLSSRWVNTQRDPALPSQLRVVDFGSGFRGAWDDSNDNRFGTDFTFIASTNYGDNASFQSARLIVKTNLWNPAWNSNFSASIELSVGDNDGNCFYFRYIDEQNWYRITLCGEEPAGANITNRPLLGLSVQRRVDGKYDNVATAVVSGPAFAAYTDPLDGAGTPAGFKRVRLTVNATNENFEARVIGWDFVTASFNPAFELITAFTDASHASGRIGFGPWGQGGFGANNATNGIPIGSGAFMDNIILKSPADGPIVFSEDWESVPLTNQFPSGWTNPYEGTPNLGGDWRMSAHGTIAQQAGFGPNTTGILTLPKADADSLILLAPTPPTNNYVLQIGFHPFDDDGIGFVYDFQDTNNYSRVMFRSETTFDGTIPPGLSVSRKSGGAWTDIVAGDASYIYAPGRPFEVEFANNNGDYALLARDLDNPVTVARWRWTDVPASPTNRFGLACWAMPDAHFLYARASSLPTVAPVTPFKITNITVTGGNVTLNISRPDGSTYHVLRATSVTGPYTTNAANQTGAQYIEPLPAGTAHYYRLQLLP